VLDLIQSGPDGGRYYPGFEPIGAGIPGNWDQWILNPDRSAPSELAFAASAFRYVIRDDPDWEVEQFDPKRDFKLAADRKIAGQSLAQILDADDPDLSRFRRKGGKLIMYVGTADALIAPASALDYYRAVARRMGGLAVARRFIRLFVVPGMQHCQGGSTPNVFGQAWMARALKADPRYDIRLALEAWVERQRTPRSLTAVRYNDENQSSKMAKVNRIFAY
jgi:feruloyl esterase